MYIEEFIEIVKSFGMRLISLGNVYWQEDKTYCFLEISLCYKVFVVDIENKMPSYCFETSSSLMRYYALYIMFHEFQLGLIFSFQHDESIGKLNFFLNLFENMSFI